jgi:hypothetical protein
MLTFQVQGTGETLSIRPRRVLMAGYTGRDQAAVQRHIDELREHGVPAPTRVPILFPATVDRLTMADEIEVLGDQTSGEAEFVLIDHGGRVYVAVGSDQTDRELEKTSITFAKQVCPNVLSRQVWPYADVRDRWDAIVLRARTRGRDGKAGPERRYQEGTLAEMLRPEDLERLVGERVGGELEGTVIYSGTIPIRDEGGFAFGGAFTAELEDPATGRILRCAYRVREVPLTEDG